MRRTVAALAAVSCLLLTAGCGGDDTESTSTSGSGASSGDPSSGSPSSGGPGSGSPGASAATTIRVTFEGDSVTPNGERVDAAVGKPVELLVSADRPGEIHVHSSPEQELTYDAGTTRLQLTIDQPGVVDVESHTLDKTIVQLEVR